MNLHGHELCHVTKVHRVSITVHSDRQLFFTLMGHEGRAKVLSVCIYAIQNTREFDF